MGGALEFIPTSNAGFLRRFFACLLATWESLLWFFVVPNCSATPKTITPSALIITNRALHIDFPYQPTLPCRTQMVTQPVSIETETNCCDLGPGIERQNINNPFGCAPLDRHYRSGPIVFRAVKAICIICMDFHFLFQGCGPLSKVVSHKLFDGLVPKLATARFFIGTRSCGSIGTLFATL